MIGGLYRYLREGRPKSFQPMNSNWGLVDPLVNPPRGKPQRRAALAERAQEDFLAWTRSQDLEASLDPAAPRV